ncbi:MAG: hypothetical protein NVV63_12965 [Opitutus sp.]|nr:hypothetical protein [Opitutus sp.]
MAINVANVIRKVSPNGEVTTFAGFDGRGIADGSLAQARFLEPANVKVDKNGAIYVADSGNHTIRKIVDGKVETIAGVAGKMGYANGAANALMYYPDGMAVSSDGLLYFGDGSDTIRVLSSGGTVTFFAGGPNAAGWADGAASNALFLGSAA